MLLFFLTFVAYQIRKVYHFSDSSLKKSKNIMIDSYKFNKATKEIEITKNEVAYQAPNAAFVFQGIDDEFVYFNVVAKQSQITEMEKRNILEKTRFESIEIYDEGIYKSQLKVSYLI